MSKTIPQVPLLTESSLKANRVGLEGVLVEQDGEVHVASVRNELIGDVRDMVAGFLKDNCMEPTTNGRDDVGKISAHRAWILLKKGKAKLMMHEIAVSCGDGAESVGLGLLLDLGCPKLTTGRINAFSLGKKPASVRRLEPTELWVPARAALALLLALEAVRTGCVPS